MERAEFEAGYRNLVSQFSATTGNVGCLACERCERSSDSTFCVDCRAVTRCHYCTACSDCIDSTHSERSTGCLMCSHCVECERCVSSAYLVRSVGCSGCTYCFGCVGLNKKDFHILNEPYDRQTYFEITGRLAKQLRILSMRAVVQRVSWAKVEVDGEVVGAVDGGLLVYLGVSRADTEADRAYVLKKVVGLRIFPSEDGKMNRSVGDVGGALLVVSQFTLYGDVRRGLRPSFDEAMRAEEAEAVCDAFVREARALVPKVETGRFRADMKVSSLNDGPVTIWIDSRTRE